MENEMVLQAMKERLERERRMNALLQREQLAKTELAEFMLKFAREQAAMLELKTVKIGGASS